MKDYLTTNFYLVKFSLSFWNAEIKIIPITIRMIPITWIQLILPFKAKILIKDAKIMLVEVKQGTTWLAFALVKAYWVISKVDVAKINVANVKYSVISGIVVIRFETVCNALVVPAVSAIIIPTNL